ncbi:MAG: AfsR/SARP family transcriptional regulator [Egibacteraceae bacterium]
MDVTVDSLMLEPGITVDVHRTAAAAHRLLHGQATEADFHRAGLTGALLPDWYDEWVLLEREQLQQLCLHALETMAEQLSGRGHHGEAVAAALAAVAGEPLRESAHRTLAAAYLAEGNVAAAARQFQRYERLADRELGVAPSPLFRRLFAALPLNLDAGPLT